MDSQVFRRALRRLERDGVLAALGVASIALKSAAGVVAQVGERQGDSYVAPVGDMMAHYTAPVAVPVLPALVHLVVTQEHTLKGLAGENLRQYREQALILTALKDLVAALPDGPAALGRALFNYLPPHDGACLMLESGIVLAGEALRLEDLPLGLWEGAHATTGWHTWAVERIDAHPAYRLAFGRNGGGPITSVEVKSVRLLCEIVGILLNQQRLAAGHKTLSRYLPSGVAERLLSGDVDPLAGQETRAAILLSDIRGFTALTRQLGPQRTVAVLNTYFARMVDLVRAAGGMVDKFMGDGLLSVFGLHSNDQGACVGVALSVAEAMLRALPEVSSQVGVDLKIGIGISYGRVISGSIGGPQRQDYTVIGNPVNAAAKAQAHSRGRAVPILLTEQAFAVLDGDMASAWQDQVYHPAEG